MHSITGVAPAFNGSLAFNPSDGPVSIMSIYAHTLMRLAALAGADPNEFVYDFKLDQWGLRREAGEPLMQHLERVTESGMWKSSNTALYDLSATGAAKIARERLRMSADTYYFSFSGRATFTHPLTGFAVPVLTINPVFYESARILGRMHIDPELPGDPREWRNGDGCVSCAGGRYVLGQPHRDADPADMSFPPGIWNSFPTMEGYDHMAMVGIESPFNRHHRDVMPFYSDLARMLTATEPSHDAAAAAPGAAPRTAPVKAKKKAGATKAHRKPAPAR